MQIDPAQQSTRSLYSWMVGLITPRPIAWVSTIADDGTVNLAPFSFFNGLGANPPTILFCPANRRDGSPKDTLANIRQNGQFVVNLVTESFAEAMNQTAAEWAPDVDEFEMADVFKADSVIVRPPRVSDAAGALECELHDAIQVGVGPGGANLVIGRIVWMHVADHLLDDNGHLDASQLDTIGRMGGSGYVRTTDRFEMPRPQPPQAGIDG
jgi:flavin reductase (DIM6/NTAB) family NADH-FMN oxidoreductase RutF